MVGKPENVVYFSWFESLKVEKSKNSNFLKYANFELFFSTRGFSGSGNPKMWFIFHGSKVQRSKSLKIRIFKNMLILS